MHSKLMTSQVRQRTEYFKHNFTTQISLKNRVSVAVSMRLIEHPAGAYFLDHPVEPFHNTTVYAIAHEDTGESLFPVV